jgi:hypothetical protein
MKNAHVEQKTTKGWFFDNPTSNETTPGVAPNDALEVQKGLVTYKSLSKNDPSVCTKNLHT